MVDQGTMRQVGKLQIFKIRMGSKLIRFNRQILANWGIGCVFFQNTPHLHLPTRPLVNSCYKLLFVCSLKTERI